jgi:hypothetical protein
LDNTIVALCRTLSKDQIALLEDHYEQFYNEVSEVELDNKALSSRLA